MTMTTQVATIVGPLWRSVDASAPGPLAAPCEILVDEEAGVVDGDAQRDAHDEHRGHVDRLAGGAEHARRSTATGSTLTNMALAASVQSRSERKNVTKHVSAMISDAGDLAARDRVVHVGPEHRDARDPRRTRPGMFAEVLCENRRNLVLRQLLEPGVVEIGEEHDQAIRAERRRARSSPISVLPPDSAKM